MSAFDEALEEASEDIAKLDKHIKELEAERDRLREALVTSNVKLHDYSTSIGSRVENATYVINEALKGG